MSRLKSRWNRLLEGRFSYLLFSILLLLLLQPFFYNFEFGHKLLRVFFLLTLLTALYSISDNKRKLTAGLILAFVAVGAIGSSYIVHETRLLEVGFLVFILFLLLITVSILRHVLKAQEVTADIVYSALCVYLLIGFIWASAYFVVESYAPGSLELDGIALATRAGSREAMFSKCLYYSYVTLTTLGYGDMKPTNPPAQSLAYVEALTGQLYLAVLVARMVALHIVHSTRK